MLIVTQKQRFSIWQGKNTPVEYYSLLSAKEKDFLSDLVDMVVVAQSAERLVVVQEVAGSTPVDHPENKGSLWQ